jgi:hypothetical protein
MYFPMNYRTWLDEREAALALVVDAELRVVVSAQGGTVQVVGSAQRA